MKKWYFSDNGQVTGPYSLNDVVSVVSQNSELYGWNPSFSQWLPVTQIPELSQYIAENKQVAQVSKELIEKFVNKKRDLNKKIKLIDGMIKNTYRHIKSFEEKIFKYKELTSSLDSCVQDNIQPIEKKYQAACKQFKELNKASDIAKLEIVDVVKEFGELVLSKASDGSDELLELDDLPHLKQSVNETNIKENTVQNASKENASNIEIENSQPRDNYALPDNAQLFKNIDINKEVNVEKKVEVLVTENNNQETVDDNLFPEGKSSFYDVKNKLKSVFKAKEEAAPMKLSDQLKMLESVSEEEKEVVFVDTDDGNEEEQKKKRRRRRRF